MDSFPEQFTALQRDFLTAFFRYEPRFSLIGGGALAYYLPERQARDLDLVCPADVVLRDQVATLREVARRIDAQIAFPERSPALLRCSLRRAGQSLQIDLSIRRAQIRVGEKTQFGPVRVDSLLTLASHKLLALCFRSRPRDLVDLCVLLDSGLSLAEIVDDSLRREPSLDAAAIHAALSAWSAQIAPEDRARLAALQPQLQSLLRRMRGLCFDIANHRAPQSPSSLRRFSPLQGDLIRALFRLDPSFCLTGGAALAFYSPTPLPAELVLWSPPDTDLAWAERTLAQAADACGGQSQVMQAERDSIVVRVRRDTEDCSVEVMLAQHRRGVSSSQRFGALVVDSPRALAANSLLALWRRRRGVSLWVLKAALDLGGSVKQAVCDVLGNDRAADLPGLAWAIATLCSPEDSSAALFHEALPFRQELLREMRSLAYEEACNQPMATVHAVLARDGAQPVSGRKPILYMMGGGYGAGKSTLALLLKEQGQIPSTNIVCISADEIMTSLPRYKRFIKNRQFSDAEAVHIESNAIVEDIVERALEMRADIVYDGALTNPQKAIAKLQEFKDAGYEIRVFGVTVDPAIAVARVARRAVTRERLNIPVEELRASHEGFREGFPAYARIADSIKLYDSNGASATLIASRDAQGGDAGTALQIHDAAAFERFRATADFELHEGKP